MSAREQISLFGDGPRAATAPQQRKTEPFIHLCAAPDCRAWGAFGFGFDRIGEGRWFCQHHKHLGGGKHEHDRT